MQCAEGVSGSGTGSGSNNELKLHCLKLHRLKLHVALTVFTPCRVLRGCQEVEQAALADVIAVRERDPSCTAYSSALLYYKGYHALQTHRIAHGLWGRGQQVLARSLQVFLCPGLSSTLYQNPVLVRIQVIRAC